MFVNILEKVKELVVLALNKAVAAWNRFADWFTVDKAQSVAATLAVSGIAFFELVSPWFALPFFVMAVVLTGLILHARSRPDLVIDNLPPADSHHRSPGYLPGLSLILMAQDHFGPGPSRFGDLPRKGQEWAQLYPLHPWQYSPPSRFLKKAHNGQGSRPSLGSG